MSSKEKSGSYVETILAREKPLPPVQWKNILSEIQWISFLALTIPPMLAVYGLATVPLRASTFIWAVTYYFMTGLGITAGYHRLWSHRSYTASTPLQYFLMCMGSGAVQGSILWWARGHRSHHRYTDTDLDPYGAHTGLVWAHMGWMVVKPRRKPGPVDTADLRKNKVVEFQKRHYIPMILFWGLVFPTVVAGLGWGDWVGGFFFAGIARLLFVHHSTFCINSLAHYLGEATFDAKHSPRDNLITALATIGEGYHNFHHEFPMDFRNAIQWYQYDPTKWFIKSMKLLGLATNLKSFPDNEVKKGKITMQLQRLKKSEDTLKFAKPVDELPVLSWDDFVEESKSRQLVVIHGFIHDVSEFINEHPGGRSLIASRIGRDATVAFEGGVYEHSNAAHNLLSMMRVGVLSGGYEPAKVWPRKEYVPNSSSASETPGATDANTSSESELPESMTNLVRRVPHMSDRLNGGINEKPFKLGADQEQKSVCKDALEYVTPGEAYHIETRRDLGSNVKMKNTKFGRLF
ncbi:stearoyl-CoA 9-desaturase [Malassezia psittaci]|uniref:stearoyl-CoA 9-desaturase n=1 Tax=Malassezia psittaci TaxID=1821823 RepID=A0AAF0FD59_9BASI|nr:stearoyl-CoA 9-desaturase [Malassezia psittaci]